VRETARAAILPNLGFDGRLAADQRGRGGIIPRPRWHFHTAEELRASKRPCGVSERRAAVLKRTTRSRWPGRPLPRRGHLLSRNADLRNREHRAAAASRHRRDGYIVICTGKTAPRGPLDQLPLTLGGPHRFSDRQSAGSWPRALARALVPTRCASVQTFSSDLGTTPGRVQRAHAPRRHVSWTTATSFRRSFRNRPSRRAHGAAGRVHRRRRSPRRRHASQAEIIGLLLPRRVHLTNKQTKKKTSARAVAPTADHRRACRLRARERPPRRGYCRSLATRSHIAAAISILEPRRSVACQSTRSNRIGISSRVCSSKPKRSRPVQIVAFAAAP